MESNDQNEELDKIINKTNADIFITKLSEGSKEYLKGVIQRQYLSGSCKEMDYIFVLCGGNLEEANPLEESNADKIIKAHLSGGLE